VQKKSRVRDTASSGKGREDAREEAGASTKKDEEVQRVLAVAQHDA